MTYFPARHRGSVLLALVVALVLATGSTSALAQDEDAAVLESAFALECLLVEEDGADEHASEAGEKALFAERVVVHVGFDGGEPGADTVVQIVVEDDAFADDEFSEASDADGLSCFREIPLGKLRVIVDYGAGAAASFVELAQEDGAVELAIDRQAGSVSARAIARAAEPTPAVGAGVP